MNVTVTSTGTLVEALDDLNKSLTKAQKETGRKVAGIGRRILLEAALRHRGTLSMSGFKIRRLGASAHVSANPTSTFVTIRAKPAGPWAIVEAGTVKGSPAFRTWSLATRSADSGDLDRALAELFDKAFV